MTPEHKKYILENRNNKSVKEIAGILNLKEKAVRRLLEREKVEEKISVVEARPAGRKKQKIILCLVLIALTFLFYSGSFKNDFVWDDKYFIVDDLSVHTFTDWQKVFYQNQGYFKDRGNNFYRPVYSLMNMLNYRMGGGTPLIFHVTNTLFHAASAVLVFMLLLLIFNNIYAAFGAALLFALNPVQTEAVTYIAGRADPMYTFFALSSIITFIKFFNEGKKIYFYFSSLAFFVLAVLSKEAGIITPFLILLCLSVLPKKAQPPPEKSKVLALAPYFVILGIYILLRATVLNFSKAGFISLPIIPPPLYSRILTACKAIFLYFKFLLVPVRFQLETYLPVSRSLMETRTLMAVTGVVCLTTLFFFLGRKSKNIFFGTLWFFLLLFPMLNIIPINAIFSVHWIYLASVGFFFILSTALWQIFERFNLKPYVFVAVILIYGVVLGAMTYEKNKEWKDDETLYNSILPLSQTPRIWINLGNSAIQKKDLKKAESCYLRALEIAPQQSEAYGNLGYIYNTENRFDKAEEILKKGISINPKVAGTHFNLGVCYAKTGRYADAIKEVNTTLELSPNHDVAFKLKGEVYMCTGNIPGAKEAFEKSLHINPDQPDLRKQLEKIQITLAGKKGE